MLGESPQLHAMLLFRKVSLKFHGYRLGRLGNTMCGMLVVLESTRILKKKKKERKNRKKVKLRGKEGRVEKKLCAGAGAQTRDLPCARQESPAARHGGC